MPRLKSTPCALTIAGSDTGGGAGIQADLKTFMTLGVHGTSALTCITAQNPKRVVSIQACSPRVVLDQIAAVFEELPPQAVKIGMLYSASIIDAVAEFLSRKTKLPIVLDPVMISTSRRQLLEPRGMAALQKKLLPAVTLVTPNLHEAEVLIRRRIVSPEDLRRAARQISEQFGCATLAKGGHLSGTKQAIDFFYDGKEELMLTAPYVSDARTHGTGCTYSAAIAAHMARGRRLDHAVIEAKEFITRAIATSITVSGHPVLNLASGSR